MVIDAVLFKLQKILHGQNPVYNQIYNVALLPEMKLSHKDGIKVTHPVTGYELWLTGSIDYTVIYYDRKQGDHHCESYYYSFNYFFGSTFSDQLVKSGGAKRLSF